MTIAKFTALETLAIKSFKGAFNYSSADDEKADNATAINAAEIAHDTGMSLDQAKGVIGSLTTKGLLTIWDEPDMKGEQLITDTGIDEYYEIAE